MDRSRGSDPEQPPDPAGQGWRPTERVPSDPPPSSYGSPTEGRPPIDETPRRARAFSGQIRSLQQRTETDARDGAQAGATLILTFRLERFDNDGNRLQPVPVEMRGRSFEGALADGDWVEVSGKWRDGTLRANRVRDLTTGAVVRARSKWLTRAIPVLVVVAIAIAAFVTFVGPNVFGSQTPIVYPARSTPAPSCNRPFIQCIDPHLFQRSPTP